MSIKAYGNGAKEAVEKAKDEIFKIDRTLDRKDKNSEIFKLNTEKGVKISKDTLKLIERAKAISEKTNGAFDITIAPVMDLWGFYGQEFKVPNETEIKDGIEKVDFRNIEITNDGVILNNNNTTIDLGAIAKGYASDIVANTIKSQGVNSAIISLGGNVMAIGNNPDGEKWRVGIQSPDNSSDYIGIINVSDKAVVTSGGYERYFEENGIRYHHIIDPKTGYSANKGLKSVTVIADSGEYADGLSTALYVLGLDEGIEIWRENRDFDFVFITDDDKIHITDDIASTFETEYDYEIVK